MTDGTMVPRYIFLILFPLSCGLVHQVFGDDDECGDDLDLSLSYWFNFRDGDISLQWQLNNQTDCPVEYHVIITDADLGVVTDLRTEGNSTTPPISPCVAYGFAITAINKAFPTVEGPAVTMTIVFTKKVQTAPILETLDIQATSINMTYRLQGSANRCSLIRLYVNGGKYFNQTVALQDPLDRAPEMVSVEIASLTPNRMYFFQVYVENNAGMSAPTQLAVQTLESTDESND